MGPAARRPWSPACPSPAGTHWRTTSDGACAATSAGRRVSQTLKPKLSRAACSDPVWGPPRLPMACWVVTASAGAEGEVLRRHMTIQATPRTPVAASAGFRHGAHDELGLRLGMLRNQGGRLACPIWDCIILGLYDMGSFSIAVSRPGDRLLATWRWVLLQALLLYNAGHPINFATGFPEVPPFLSAA